ncbi:thiosulfate sulfurtransferase isoform X2 [Acinonyx jubatus]|uniref:Sulfurtransferase n=3 Tax=Felidae TaxID=9681 RepID=A0A6J2ADM3_ACIJB|nr:thiosulfate sulfurtransferase isoform X2 [Acinonyx jubatus]
MPSGPAPPVGLRGALAPPPSARGPQGGAEQPFLRECKPSHWVLGPCRVAGPPQTRRPAGSAVGKSSSQVPLPCTHGPHTLLSFPGFHPRQVMRRAETMVHQVLYRALVSTKWLAESVRAGKLGPGLRVLDASWYSPGTREARKEYLERHVPGASFFDIEECRNAASPYEMMLPSEADFAHYVGRLGISNQTHVVVYDGDHLGSFYAPRVWWMFRVFGHRTVSVLNGGFRNWLKEGHPVTSEPSRPEPANFEATLDRSLLKTYEQVLENLESKRFQLVDARSQGRYLGTEPEPDAVGLDPGHIRGSVNMPFVDFLTEDGFEKSPEELRALFEAKKVNLAQPLIATCRKGVTACHIALAAYLCGKPDVAVYDGSWFEWFHRAPPETRVSQWQRGKA